MAAADLVEYVAKSLVDDPEAVKVEVVNGEEGTIIELHVADQPDRPHPPFADLALDQVAAEEHLADPRRALGSERVDRVDRRTGIGVEFRLGVDGGQVRRQRMHRRRLSWCH